MGKLSRYKPVVLNSTSTLGRPNCALGINSTPSIFLHFETTRDPILAGEGVKHRQLRIEAPLAPPQSANCSLAPVEHFGKLSFVMAFAPTSQDLEA